ncbi:MAG: LCP family protein [Actinomycetota bacterium]|nr:LCP family protein [Actinomycetota bacterium]
MLPASSPGLRDRSAPPPAGQLSRIRFRRAVALMVMTLLLPGSAQLAAGNRRTGRIALRIVVALVGLVTLLVLIGTIWSSFVFWLLSNLGFLAIVRFGLMALALGWAYLFVDAWRLGDPLALRQKQRLAMVGINGVLCFSVAGSLLFASHVVTVQRNFIATMFTSGKVTSAHAGRFNVLLLGGDSGKTRWGLRPDSITVASIDADTGKTVLFGLPRNMQNFPFAKGSVMRKQFPHGYGCQQCELNSLVTWAGDHTSLFKGYANPGIEATKEAVEGITGLKINYYVMVNLSGFRNLVDAVGGVTLTVRDPIPMGAIGAFDGKSYIKPGTRRLNGNETLWFARSRMAADDYSRMARQKCVMNAMLHQLSPQEVVLKFGKIAEASAAMVTTDIPASELARFMQLAMKARSQPVRTVSFVPPMIKTYRPDIAKIRSAVAKVVSSSGAANQAAKPTGKPRTGTTGGSYGNIQDGYAANQTTNLGNAC